MLKVLQSYCFATYSSGGIRFILLLFVIFLDVFNGWSGVGGRGTDVTYKKRGDLDRPTTPIIVDVVHSDPRT